MASIPNLETILLTIHEALGCPAPRKKLELRELRRPWEKHLEVVGGLVGDILESLGLEGQESWDSLFNLEEFANFHKTLEVKTWTFGASQQHILWHLLACVYVPGLARRAAFWQLAAPMDPDMPGREFWYLPMSEPGETAAPLRLPMVTVLHWLEDLLGQPVHKATPHWPDPDVDLESVKRTLEKWRAGDVPRRDTIDRYFADRTEFTFSGCLALPEGRASADAMEVIRTFLTSKNLTAEDLRGQIPLTEPGLIEAALDGTASASLTERFIELVTMRYSRPTLSAVRRRLLIARAGQIGYLSAHATFCPDVPLLEADARRNKALQLVQIFQRIYNLTIAAAKSSNDWHAQDSWFEQQLLPWEQDELYLAIVPSRRSTAALDLAERLTRHFDECQPDEPLEDWVWLDEDSLNELFARVQRRLRRSLEELEELEMLQRKLLSGSPWRALQAAQHFANVRAIAADPMQSVRIRQLAGQRLRELAASGSQFLDAVLIEADFYVGGVARPHSPDARSIVESLLTEAEANPARDRRRPQILAIRARHALNSNDFDGARRHFAEALAVAVVDGCGDRPGLLARDAFALDCAYRPPGFSASNYERHWRLMLSFNVFNGPQHSVEAVAEALGPYFWEDLYRPYPDVPRLAPTSA
jgi:hypothetical protein